ncbi:MAG: SpoIIE family protein phosphatase [Syntrophobacteraceae bacterium]
MPGRSPLQSLAGVLGSFRLLVLLMLVGFLAAAVAAFMLFTRREVTGAMLEAGDREAKNVLRAVRFDIEGRYKDLESFKHYAMTRHREQLRDISGLVVAQIEFFNEMAGREVLPEGLAKQLALEAVEKLRVGNCDYFAVYDANDMAISHPLENIRGQDMSWVKDIYDRPVLETARNEAGEKGESFITISWRRFGEAAEAPKLLYFAYYPKWDWLIGAGVYIDDIDSDVRKKMNGIARDLGETLADMRLFDTGHYFLFSGDKKTVIPPRVAEAPEAGTADAPAGGDRFEALERASRNPGVPGTYLWDKPEFPGRHRFTKYSHVERFEPFDWYVASSVYKDEIERPARDIEDRQVIFAAWVVGLCATCACLFLFLLMRPLRRLAHHAARLGETDFSLPPAPGDELPAIRFPSEMSRLAEVFRKMESRLREYLVESEKSAAARERVRIVSDIRMGMLPQNLSGIQTGGDIDLSALLHPGGDAGSDLYDFFFIDGSRLCLFVGDASDSGIPAALFMLRCRTLLRNAAPENPLAPDKVLAKVNRELAEGNDARMFVTAFLGTLDIETGELVYSNAGHAPPLILPAVGGGCETLDLPTGKPLGISGSTSYTSRWLLLGAGDGLLVFTDGVTDAENAEGNLYGDIRLRDLLRDGMPAGGAGEVVRQVFESVRDFSRGVPPAGDIAILCAGPARKVEGPANTG